jgi:HPt (histidine-containing phosphotransfer) domain-containing protein
MIESGTSPEPLYSTLAEDPYLGQIVPMFVAEMPDRVGQLLARLEAGDWQGLREAAHQMKGAAGSYGFQPITPAAARLEQAIKSGEPEAEIRRLTEALTALCGRVSAGSPHAETAG